MSSITRHLQTAIFLFGLMAVFIYGLVISFTPGALYDMWEMLHLLPAMDEGKLTISNFLGKHNGVHVIAIPKLFYLAEYRFFHGQGYFLASMSLLCLVACFWILLKQLFAQKLHEERSLLLMLVATICFSGLHIPNLVWGFQLQWYLGLLFALVSILFLTSREPRAASREPLACGLSILFAGLSSLCNFAGVVILLLVIVVAAFQSRSLITRGFFLAGIPLLAWFFYPEKTFYLLNDGSLLDFDEHLKSMTGEGQKASWFPWLFVTFLQRLGNPVNIFSHVAGLVVGAGVLGLLLTGCYKRYLQTRCLDFWMLLTAYAILLAAAITLGRYSVGGVGNENRFVTLTLVVSICGFYWLCERFSSIHLWKLVIPFISIFMIAGFVEIYGSSQTAIRREKANVSIQNGVFFNAAYEKTYYWVPSANYNPFAMYHDYLKRKRLDVFYRLPVTVPAGIANECHAQIKKAYNLPRNQIKDYYLDIRDAETGRAIREFYLLKNNQVVYYGIVYPVRKVWMPAIFRQPDDDTAYTTIPATFSLQDFDLAGVNVNGQFCKITLSKS